MPRIPLNKISQFIPKQLPEFVRENYPTFVDFVQAYYEFLEKPGNVVDGIFNVLNDRDPDKTIPDFIKYFQYEFLSNIPVSVLTDKVKLLKHIKEFYQTRGSEKSYKFLFRILYNEDINFYLPKLDLMKTSNGIWTTDTVLRTTTTTNTFNFIGKILTGNISGATADVENVIQFQIEANTVSEVYISNIKGTFISNETISCNNQQESLYNLLAGVTIVNAGLKYKTNDEVIVTDNTGVSALVVVDKTTGKDNGRVVQASNEQIINPGPSQIIIPPSLILKNTSNIQDNYYQNMIIEIIDGPGLGQIKNIVSYTGSTREAIVDSDWTEIPTIQSHYSISLGKIVSVKIKDFGINYSLSTSIDFTQIGDGTAIGNAIISPVASYSSKWLTSDSFLSDIKKIQDSFFWQDFSYVLKVQESKDQYEDIVNKLLHPAGMKLFGEVEINNRFHIGADYRTLERNKFKFAPYEGFVQNYPFPNLNYWNVSNLLQISVLSGVSNNSIIPFKNPGSIFTDKIIIQNMDHTNSIFISSDEPGAPSLEIFPQNYYTLQLALSSWVPGETIFFIKGITIQPIVVLFSSKINIFTNTPMLIEKDLINGNIDKFPDTKHNHVADCFLNIISIPDSIPTNDESVEYDFIQGVNSQVLYDIRNVSDLKNGILGSTTNVDPNDPAWVY